MGIEGMDDRDVLICTSMDEQSPTKSEAREHYGSSKSFWHITDTLLELNLSIFLALDLGAQCI